MSSQRFAGKVLLITGAGTGIGREIALAYAREGASVAMAARRVEPLEETARLASPLGAETLVVRADVSSEVDAAALVARTLERFGRLDVLVNNAGVPGADQPVAEMSLANWNETIAINLTGPMLLTREALRQAMVPAQGGNIQFLSSAAAKRVRPRKAHYAAAKMGLIPLAQTLALEVSGLGIRVNTIVVGLVAGELVERWIERMARQGERSEPEIRRALVADIPMKRPVEAREVADLSLYLASESASAITGQAINVTCGYEMR
jgi:NAD(P)-dependent dehydrogenase (short-subunit alcohol dehydrogenase family)